MTDYLVRVEDAIGKMRIFISYRRSDSLQYVYGLREGLLQLLPNANVFLDEANIPLGASFPQLLDRELLNSTVILAIIGPQFERLAQHKECQRTLGEYDYVQQELGRGLMFHEEQRKLIVPVYVGRYPGSLKRNLLPPSIAPLAEIHGIAFDIGNRSPLSACQRIVDEIRSWLEEKPDAESNFDPMKLSVANYSRATDRQPAVQDGPLRRAPADAVTQIQKVRDVWEFEIHSESDPSYEISSYTHTHGHFAKMDYPTRADILGALIEWYGVRPENCLWYREDHHNLFQFLGITRRTGEYRGRGVNPVFRQFPDLVSYLDRNICSRPIAKIAVPGQDREIPGTLSYVGRTEIKRVFGTYVGSASFCQGGSDQQSGELYCLPKLFDTQLYFVNLKERPFLHMDVHFHFGVDDLGYHSIWCPNYGLT